jgi:hypothetical protein
MATQPVQPIGEHYNRGREAEREGDWKRAELEYDFLAERMPDDQDIQERLRIVRREIQNDSLLDEAEAALQGNRPNAAAAALSKVEQRSSDSRAQAYAFWLETLRAPCASLARCRELHVQIHDQNPYEPAWRHEYEWRKCAEQETTAKQKCPNVPEPSFQTLSDEEARGSANVAIWGCEEEVRTRKLRGGPVFALRFSVQQGHPSDIEVVGADSPTFKVFSKCWRRELKRTTFPVVPVSRSVTIYGDI